MTKITWSLLQVQTEFMNFDFWKTVLASHTYVVYECLKAMVIFSLIMPVTMPTCCFEYPPQKVAWRWSGTPPRHSRGSS